MKRLVAKVAMFVLVGAIMNVAVAWGCAWLIQMDVSDMTWLQRKSGPNGKHEFAMCAERIGASQITYLWYVNVAKAHFSPLPPVQRHISAILAVSDRQRHLVREWKQIPYDSARVPKNATVEDSSGLASHMCVVDSRGWPFPSLFAKATAPNKSIHPNRCERGIKIGEWPTTNSIVQPNLHVLPYGVVAGGFAINTIFYAVTVSMLVAVPGAVRGSLRKKRGQCASCGYSLRGHDIMSDRCPECGAKPVDTMGLAYE